jgi:hypothetical protein
MTPTRPDFLAEVEKLEAKLGTPKGLFINLLHEDDWSFVIKMHALIDACLTHLIVNRLNNTALVDLIARLEFADARTGKLRFGDRLNLFNKEELTFLRRFSEIRNLLAHDVNQVSFTFASYYASLDKNQRKSFADTIEAFFALTIDVAGEYVPRATFVRENLKFTLWSACMFVLGVMNIMSDTDQIMREADKALIDYGRNAKQLLGVVGPATFVAQDDKK